MISDYQSIARDLLFSLTHNPIYFSDLLLVLWITTLQLTAWCCLYCDEFMVFLQDWIFTITSGISPFRVITTLSKFTSVSFSCHCLNEFHDEFMDYSFPILANESMDLLFPCMGYIQLFPLFRISQLTCSSGDLWCK